MAAIYCDYCGWIDNRDLHLGTCPVRALDEHLDATGHQPADDPNMGPYCATCAEAET